MLGTLLLIALTRGADADMDGPRRALVIGIDNYEAPNALRHATSDAALVRRVLTDAHVGGVAERDVVVLSNANGTPSDHLPTAANIRDALGRLASAPQQGGILWFYFAGHGLELAGRSHLVPQDKQFSKSCTDGLLAVQEVRDQLLKACPTGQVVVVLDACHSGSPRGLELVPVLERDLGQAGNVFTLAAADVNQAAWEIPTPPGGVFTYFVVRCLSGEADSNQDGYVDAHETQEYVTSRVQGFVKNHVAAIQVPQFILPAGTNPRLSRCAAKPLDSPPNGASLSPRPTLRPTLMLSIVGDSRDLVGAALTQVIPKDEFLLVDPSARGSIDEISRRLGDDRPTAHIELGARYLLRIRIGVDAAHQEVTGTYKGVASILVELFDESGEQLAVDRVEQSAPSSTSQGAIDKALRKALDDLVQLRPPVRLLATLAPIRPSP